MYLTTYVRFMLLIHIHENGYHRDTYFCGRNELYYFGEVQGDWKHQSLYNTRGAWNGHPRGGVGITEGVPQEIAQVVTEDRAD